MSPTEYDTDIFLGKKFIFFWCHAFWHQNSHLWNTTIDSLEHNCHIFGKRCGTVKRNMKYSENNGG